MPASEKVVRCTAWCIFLVLAPVLAGCASEPGSRVTHASPEPKADTRSCPLMRPAQAVNPAFPRSMIREGREGWVVLGFDLVPGDPAPKNVHVVSSDPGGAFDVEALRALAASRFAVDKSYVGCQSVVEFRLR